MTTIIGVSAFYHDSSASLIKDGEVKYASQEERFTRVKNDLTFPKNCIKDILNTFDIKLNEVDYIVFYEKPSLKFIRILKNIFYTSPNSFFYHLKAFKDWMLKKLYYKNRIFNELKKLEPTFNKNKIKFVEHHHSHAASAFFASPYQNSSIVTVDGVGELATTTISYGQNNKIKFLREIHFPDSLGLLYSAFTYYLGFKVNSGEYKLMGLAPYGTPKYTSLILNNLIDLKDDGSFKLNMSYFNFHKSRVMISNKFRNLFNKNERKENDEIEKFHMDIASSIQKVTEQILINIAKYSKKINPKSTNLCLAGGVALNCVANGKIKSEKIFKSIWVQPAAGDAGGSLGAALYYWHQVLDNKRTIFSDNMNGSYLGYRSTEKEIIKTLQKINAVFELKDNETIIKECAQKISEGFAVGWFQGRAEFGPRSLGSRSILADPRDKNMQKNLNLKIKYRESFRPFAPAILSEHTSRWFKYDGISPYMQFVSEVKDEHRINEQKISDASGFMKLNIPNSIIPSVTHIDFSSRIQTVHKDTNKKFYNLINEFYKITGVPILVNTSFNVRGEPIVNNVEDAFNCFMGTDLDILVCENFILYKKKQLSTTENNYKKKFKE